MKNLLFIFIGCLLAFCSCKSDDTNTTYCNKPARLILSSSRVLSKSVLYTACVSWDQYCTITTDGKYFIFKSAYGKCDSLAILQEDKYNNYLLGIGGGLIVGLPSIAELGQDNPRVICYDLHCPNCWEDLTITKRLTLNSDCTAYCPTCKRTYNLNNIGIVEKGDAGRQLYRYRVNYTEGALVINN